jgi:hypothetical protein
VQKLFNCCQVRMCFVAVLHFRACSGGGFERRNGFGDDQAESGGDSRDGFGRSERRDGFGGERRGFGDDNRGGFGRESNGGFGGERREGLLKNVVRNFHVP